jgi:hypothetical protein
MSQQRLLEYSIIIFGNGGGGSADRLTPLDLNFYLYISKIPFSLFFTI